MQKGKDGERRGSDETEDENKDEEVQVETVYIGLNSTRELGGSTRRISCYGRMKIWILTFRRK